MSAQYPTRPASLSCAIIAALALMAGHSHAKATFVVNNIDAAGVGLNDPTPAVPVGGNAGSTVGQQRLNAFQYALDLWGKAIDSAVPIVVEASFPDFDCTTGVAPLGRASTTSIQFYIPGLLETKPGLEPSVLYPEALADRLAGTDLSPGDADITAEFNGSVSSCLGADWYYGFDGKSGENFDLVSVILHEVGHGLGFSYLPDPTTGELFYMDMPDPYTRHLLDNSTSRHFDVMTTSERLASTGNVRHIVWDGPYVTQAVAAYLAPGAPNLTVNPPIAGLFGALLEMNYGPHVPAEPITGPLSVGNPVDGCATLAGLTGSIALLYEGNCGEMNMSKRAEVAGAKAVIFVGESTITPPKSSVEYAAQYLNAMTWAIPTVQLSKTEGDLLRGAVASGVNVTLAANPTQRVGADPSGKAYIYASVPTTITSSLSHWDPLCRPNLVLEPAATLDNPRDLTMETALLRDIGWEPFCGNGRPDATEECDNGTANSDTAPDACRKDCTKAKCGDGIVDSSEQCDSASDNSDTLADACRTNCVKAKCGDKVVDTGEQCDDGAANGKAGSCGTDCKLPSTSSSSGAPGTTSSGGDSGCGCKVQSTQSDHRSWLMLGLLVLALRRVRRVYSPRRTGAASRSIGRKEPAVLFRLRNGGWTCLPWRNILERVCCDH